jgi:hypothetical protein
LIINIALFFVKQWQFMESLWQLFFKEKLINILQYKINILMLLCFVDTHYFGQVCQ